MSTSASLPLVASPESSSTSEYQRAASHEEGAGSSAQRDVDPYADSDKSCGLRKHKKPLICLVVCLFAVGLAIIIWATVKRSHGGGDSPDEDGRKPLTLDTMFDRTISPSRASLAWIAGPSGSDDQYVNVVNGSFYLTTLPEVDKPQLLISASDLAPFAFYTPPVVAAASISRRATSKRQTSSSRHLLADSFDERAGMPDVETLHESAARHSGPAVPRTLRRKPSAVSHGRMKRHSQQQLFTKSSTAIPVRRMSRAAAENAALEEAAAAVPSFAYSSYALSPDQAHMVFGVNSTQLYRHSSFATYLVYTIGTKTMTPLADGAALRLVVWSPRSDALAYVLDNNVFVHLISSVGPGATKQVTTDGLWDSVLNGVADWVTEEEIFEDTSAIWWAPDGGSLAFGRFNETAVEKYNFDFYTQPYNTPFTYKYPKPGFANSIIDVHTYNLTSEVVSTFSGLRAAVSFDVEYVMNVVWLNSAEVMVRVENREQNAWQLVKLDSSSGDEKITLLSSAKAQTYFEPQSSLTTLYPIPAYVDLVFDGVDHLHLAAFSSVDGSLIKYLTGGSYDVLSLDAVNIDSSLNEAATFFFTRETYQTDAQLAAPALYAVNYATTTNGSDARQLVAPAVVDGKTLTSWQSGSYSPSAKYFLLQESSIAPVSTLYSVSMDGPTATVLKVLADNTALVASVAKKYRVPTTTYTQIESTISGLMLSLSILVPAGVDLADTHHKHPVLIAAYSGPGSQQMTTAYGLGYASQGLFHASLVSSHKYIVVTVDTVGTAGKGESYRKDHTYLRLGLQERADMIKATKWIRDQRWADEDRVSYWGWSYGGFLTSFTAAAGTGLFANLISVAPVTSWALYDSVYTERYMGTPATNPDGYYNTSVIAAASTGDFDDIWHLFGGTADDNVHFQNSALLVDALIDADVPFSAFYFPNRAHSLLQWKSGKPPRYLYEQLTRLLTNRQEAKDCKE